MIKSYRRKGWPKGKASSALPLIALGLGLYAVSRTGRAKATATPATPATPAPGPAPVAPAPAPAPGPGGPAPSSAPATEAEKAWAMDLVAAINNSGTQLGPERQADMIAMMEKVNAQPGAAAKGLQNIRAAMHAGLPPSVETYCLTLGNKIPGVVPLISREEIRATHPITDGMIAELCEEGQTA